MSNLTSISAGLLIYDLLSKDEGVKAVSSKVFPVVSEEGAKLPYICYRRSGTAEEAVKNHYGADTTTIEVACFADTYAHSVKMAEAVRACLDNVQAEYESADGKLVARSIIMTDASEVYDEDGAYLQQLSFTIKI